MTKPKTSRQNQRPHGKTKYFTAKTKFLTAKANITHSVSCGPSYGSYHEFTNNNFAFHESQNQFFTFSRFTNNRGHTKCQKRCISPIL